MTRTIVIIACAALAAQFTGCGKKPVPPTQKEAAPAPTMKAPFAPSTDSVVTTGQISAWLAGNPLLDSLTYPYADSFKTPEPGIRLRLQSDFTKAQDALCVRAGLTGGYEEYLWIRTHMGNPKNKARLDSLNVGVY